MIVDDVPVLPAGAFKFAGGVCHECDRPYLLVAAVKQIELGKYCSTRCTKRAKERRKNPPSTCPTPECGRMIQRPRAAVCGRCWVIVAGMCLGKERQPSEAEAERVAARTGWGAYWCRVCGWWHNGHTIEEPEKLIADVGRALEGMRLARGAIWVAQEVESFDPKNRSRREWEKCRAQSRARRQEAA